MDLEMKCSLLEVAELLREVGVDDVEVKDGKLEGKLRRGWGRIHVLGMETVDGGVYLDVHWDFLLHFIFLGVDYNERPYQICERLVSEAASRGVDAQITGGYSWSNRKNRAIIAGIRI